MKATRPFFIFLVVIAFALSAIAVAAAQKLVNSEKTASEKTAERFTLESKFVNDTPPFKADGEQKVLISIRVVDTEKNRLKPLEFALRTSNGAIVGKIASEKRKNDYLITYLTPDLKGQPEDMTGDLLYAFFLDDTGNRRFKTLEIPFIGKNALTISKRGFQPQTLDLDFDGPMAYIKVKTLLTDGNHKAVIGAAGEIPESDIVFSDSEGLLKITNPDAAKDNKITETQVILQPEEILIEKRREVNMYYNALRHGKQEIGDVSIEDFITRFEEKLANAENEKQADKLITGLYQLGDLLFVLNRGMVTADQLSSQLGKTSRLKLWESLKYLSRMEKMNDALLLFAQAKATDRQTTAAVEKLEEAISAFPDAYVEMLSSLKGAALAYHSPLLEADLVNGFLDKVMESAAARKDSKLKWDESWFEKSIASYFEAQYRQYGQGQLAQMAEMIRQNSFPENYREDLMKEQKSLYEDAIATYINPRETTANPLISWNELNTQPQTVVDSPESAYLDFLQANENVYSLLKKRFLSDTELATRLYAYDTFLQQTKAAAEIVFLQEKDAVSTSIFKFTPAMADGKKTPDALTKKIVNYQNSLVDQEFYSQLAAIGKIILPFDEQSNRLSDSIAKNEATATNALHRSQSLALQIPRKFQTAFQPTEAETPFRQTSAWRIMLFSFLLVGGFAYTLAPVFLRKPDNPLDTTDSTPVA